jgi:uncharacterized membrane protein
MFSQSLSAFMTAGAASLVEFIEALTVVLAVGAGRGWRSALAGAAGALVLLLLVALLFGPALGAIPLGPAKMVVGTLIVLFGLRWLRKATRRAGGIIPLRDEAEAFERYRARVGQAETSAPRWDRIGLLAAFQATAIEGLEVIFIVVAVGAGGTGLLRAAASGAAAALVAVVALGAVLHRPITRVPENTLKRVVGATLAGLGTFWIGDGAGLQWPGDDIAIVPLSVLYLLLSVAVAARLRAAAR